MAIQTRITQRFDVLSNWIQNDIVLLQGELAVVDCGNQTRFKVGDGTKRFTQLPFIDQSQLCTRWIAADAMSQGLHASSIPYGFAAGAYLCANASFSQALGFDAKTISSDTYSFVWNGDDTRAIEDYYTSHGRGTFSVNPLSGLSGIFIGEQNLAEVLDENSGNTITIDDQISGICKETDLSIVKISVEDYADLVTSDALLSDVLYVVEGSYEDVYGQQVKNMAPGTDLSDAVNLEQLTEVSSRAYDTYTQTEVDQKIANAQYFKKYVVQTLPPVADADERGIYLVPSTDSQLSNTYDEYVVVGEGSSKAWEKIGSKSIDLSGYKTKQTAKTSPAASGGTTSFIDAITQNENGEISATKKNVQTATTQRYGIVQLNNTLTSTSTAQAATANAVKSLNDAKVETSIKVAGQALTADVTAATISSAIGLSNYALNSNALHKTGDETATGKKTFSDAFTVGTRKSGTIGTKSFAYGLNNLAAGEGSFAGGQNSVAQDFCDHAEGYQTSAFGYATHAEGQQTYASDYCAHAEGYQTSALNYGHSEGYQTYTDSIAHAEGVNTKATGSGAHAEGEQTSALSYVTHSEGYGTIAQNNYEHAQGQCNVSNRGDYTFGLSSNTIDSIGIGIGNVRKNATEVMQNGDAYFLGVGGYDGTNAVSVTSKPLAAVLSAKADISDVSGFSSVSVDNIKADVNLLHISRADYGQLVVDDEALSNVLYVVSADYVETYGQQIKNVADPTDLSDAVNKEYVDSNFQPAGSYLTAVPAAYKTYAATLSSLSSDYSLTSHTHGDYVQTSRTVAGQALTADITAATISSAIGLGNYYGKTETSSAAQISAADYALSTELSTKSSISVDSGFAPKFKFEHISLEDYISKSISGIVDGNTLYDISSENMTVFDQKIVDLAPGEDPTDAPNMSQLTEVSARACDTYTQDEVDQKIADAEAGYKLVNADGVLSSGSYVYEVQDKAMTTIGINQSSTPVVVVLPSAGEGARDFILRIEISSASAPTFTFTNTSGLDFESEDDDWAVMEPGVNLVSFTETKR